MSILFIIFPNQILSQTAQPNLRIHAQSAALMDAISGQVLFDQNPQIRMAPASFVKLLGLDNSQFKNPHGMPTRDQFTTASDLVILARRYIEDHSEGLASHSLKEFEHQGIRQQNRNTLLRKNIGVDGLMTGYLKESGYDLVSTAKRDGQRMIAVVMGCDTLQKGAQETQKLLEYGFRNFSTVRAVKKSDPFGPEKVVRGKLKQIQIFPAEEGWVTVAKGKENSISVISDLPKFITAPVQKGQGVGKLVIHGEGRVLKEIALLSSSNVPEGIYLPWPLIGGGILLLALVGMLLWLGRRAKRRRP